MIVNISNYGQKENENFIEYTVSGLSKEQIEYLKNNLIEELEVSGDNLILTMYFDDRLYPFQSDVAQIRLDDFIAREEIEMNVYLSSVLLDMR